MVRGVVFVGLLNSFPAIDNGLGLTPPMGWRSWNCFGKHVNQTKMESIMNRMAQRTRSVDGTPTSLLDLGYNNCGLDDNWQKCGAGAFNSFHDASGNPIINEELFPDMKGMTDHGHSLGLRVGWYMNNCICQEKHWKGEDNITKHMQRSAQAVADYGFDGVKLDGCGQFMNLTWWAELLNGTGRRVLIENCHWGGTVPGQSSGDGPCVGTTDVSDCPYNFYRTSSDIRSNWGSMHKNLLTTRKFQGDVPLSRPGSWAYPDMMEVGRMRTYEEDRAHFGAWVITSSPLILGYDLNDESTTDKIWDIIANPEAIAISQTWAGHPGRQVKTWPTPSPPPALGHLVFAVPCDTDDVTQRGPWSFDPSSSAIKGPGGKCLDAAGAGGGRFGSLFLRDCDQSDLQQFKLGSNGTLNLLTQEGMCIDIWAGHGLPGGPGLSLYKCHNAHNEEFLFEDNGTLSSQQQLCFANRENPPADVAELELWMKPLEDNKVAAFVLNNGGNTTATFNLADLGLSSEMSVRDIWRRSDLPSAKTSVTVELQAHDSALLVLTPTGDHRVEISNVVPRTDSMGKILSAHDGNLVQWDDAGFFHFYGMSYGTCHGRKGGCGHQNNHNISLYTSPDLSQGTWEFQGHILPVESRPSGVYYRPKVIHNRQTGLFVLWVNWLTNNDFGSSAYLVATSRTPAGPFSVVAEKVPTKFETGGDFDIFVDDDNQAYLIYTSLAQGHGISIERLSPDYLSSTMNSTGILTGGGCYEAPSMFKRSGVYYALYGTCCNFCKTGDTRFAFTSSLPLGFSTASPLYGLGNAGGAQQNYVARIPTLSGTKYVWTGDRWMSAPDGEKDHDFQYWVPIEFNDSATPRSGRFIQAPKNAAIYWEDNGTKYHVPSCRMCPEVDPCTNKVTVEQSYIDALETGSDFDCAQMAPGSSPILPLKQVDVFSLDLDVVEAALV